MDMVLSFSSSHQPQSVIDHIASHFTGTVKFQSQHLRQGFPLCKLLAFFVFPAILSPLVKSLQERLDLDGFWHKHAAKSEIDLFGVCFLMFGGVCSTLSL